jgi:hypothetical protein
MTRAKYTTAQVLAILLFVGGLFGIVSQALPRGDSVPSVALDALGLDPNHAEKAANVASSMPKFQIVGADGQDNASKNVRLWDAMVKVRGSHLPNIAQQIGDCVSWGAAHAVDYLQAVQMVRGPPGVFQFKEAFPPYIYGISRVQVGKKHGSNFGRGDGSVGAYAAEGLRDFGCLRADATKCPPYSGSIAKEWGAKGAPDWAITEAKPFSVKTIAQVNSAAECRDAICNGYPVTIASGWWGTTRITPVDGRMVATRNTSWAHQQCVIGYDGSGSEPFFYVLNSWGDNAHPRPLNNEPPGGYWVRSRDMDHICGEGDSWALSSFDGFPAESINWDELLRRQVTVSSEPPVDVIGTGNGEMIMSAFWILVASILACVAGAALFRWAAIGQRRMKTLSGLALLLLGVGIANAQQPDFAIAASRTGSPIDWLSASERSIVSDQPATAGIVADEDWDVCAVRQKTVIKSVRRGPQALLFSAEWCKPCGPRKKAIEKTVVPLGWSYGDQEDADFRVVDIDKQPDLTRKYSVEMVPTIIYVDSGGKEYDRIVGAKSNRLLTTSLLNKR